MTHKRPSSARAQLALEKAQEQQAKANQSLVTAYETELRELRKELERFASLEEELTALAIDCGASPVSGGATGRNAIKSIRSMLTTQHRQLLQLRGEIPTEAQIAQQAQQEEEKQRLAGISLTVKSLDTIIWQTCMYSQTEDAPDVEAAMRSAVYPLIFENLTNKPSLLINENQLNLEALLYVTAEGRRLIHQVRNECQTAITGSQEVWDKHAPAIQQWTIDRVLPLFFEDEQWSISDCYTLDEMTRWRTQEASRALDFPAVFDAFNLLSSHPVRSDALVTYQREAMASRNSVNETMSV